MNEAVWDDIKRELKDIRANMATKADLQELRDSMVTKTELEARLAGMAAEIKQSIDDLKKTVTDHHLESIRADEKLMEMILEVKKEVEHHTERLNTNEYSIQILHRNQLHLETEIEKIKASLT